jgi:hypothetical protein
MAGVARGASSLGSERGACDGGRLDVRGGIFDGGRLDARFEAVDDDRGGSGGGRGRRGAPSGLSGSVFCCVADGASLSVFFLWSRQHSAHRHSTTKSPFLSRRRESRHPNCALMSV